jgi:hypothetical protein
MGKALRLQFTSIFRHYSVDIDAKCHFFPSEGGNAQ